MIKLAIVSGLIALMAGGTAFAEKEFTYPKNNNFDSNAIKSIEIDMASGDIAIDRSASDQVEVNYKNIVYAKDQKEADRYNEDLTYSAEVSGDRLLIKVEFPKHSHHGESIISRVLNGKWNNGNNPMVKVSVPDNKQIKVAAASADIDVSDVSCGLDISSASSDLVMQKTGGDVHAVISSGDVDIAGHQGNISVKGNSSDIRIADVKGNVDAFTSSGDGDFGSIDGSLKSVTASGDLRVNDIAGDLDVRTSSGDITVNSVSGSVRASGVSGDINLNDLAATNGDFDVESVSGDVRIAISKEFKGDIRASTVSGSIDSGISMESQTSTESELRGHIGDGTGRLSVSTTSGDIGINDF